MVFFLTFTLQAYGQLGTIRGIVTDQQSETVLIGANVELLGGDGIVGTTTDVDGYFTLSNVPIGRNAIRIMYLGYESTTVPNLDVTSGKDLILHVALREEINQLNEVVVRANSAKDQPKNDLATVSARQFSLEEVNRYSGGRSDVARLAANFAGVSAPDDSRNDIVIRGNSPTGVLWQLEGIPIPNPNHFSTFGTTGSPVSALNPNVLRNSDFLTSAFPAEYGNANAGVFDLGLRSGNKERSEYTLQLGAFSGLEGMAEGPMGKKGGSYLIAGRYSFIGLIGAGVTAATPDYQDISFKLDFGKSKAGRFALFGVGGRSDINFLGSEIEEGDLFAAEDEDSFVEGAFGVVGLKHNKIIGKNTYIRTVIASSFRQNTFSQDRYFNLGAEDARKIGFIEIDNSENQLSLSSYINHKFGARQTLRAGILVQNMGNDAFFQDRSEQPDADGDGDPDWFTVYQYEGRFTMIQPFVQTQYRIGRSLMLNGGLHGQYSSLNEQFVIEPRVALSYDISPTSKATVGYGIHSQHAPLPIMLLNEQVGDQLLQTNIGLDFVRSQHFVLGYDAKLGENWRLKTEVYYQDIDRAPVDRMPSSYSTLTEGADFGFATDKTSLVSEGSGFNRGLEITLEKFYSQGYHMLITSSIFTSRYEGSDEIERSTPFDNGYVVNILGEESLRWVGISTMRLSLIQSLRRPEVAGFRP